MIEGDKYINICNRDCHIHMDIGIYVYMVRYKIKTYIIYTDGDMDREKDIDINISNRNCHAYIYAALFVKEILYRWGGNCYPSTRHEFMYASLLHNETEHCERTSFVIKEGGGSRIAQQLLGVSNQALQTLVGEQQEATLPRDPFDAERVLKRERIEVLR